MISVIPGRLIKVIYISKKERHLHLLGQGVAVKPYNQKFQVKPKKKHGKGREMRHVYFFRMERGRNYIH